MSALPAVLVLGRPCAGKTTVARWLARTNGCDHISVGDLIRDAYRTDPEFARRNEAAYDGRGGFAATDLAGLLARRLAANEGSSRRIVIDGGPPMDRVAEALGLRPLVTVVLCAGAAHTEERFRGRAASASAREDDLLALFRRRSRRYELLLPATIRRLAAHGPVHLIDATVELPQVLRQAASALLLPHGTDPVRRLDLPGDLGWQAAVAELWRRSGDEGAVRFLPRDAESVPSDDRNEMVLLLKPGFTAEPAVVGQVARRAADHGYRITEASVWPGGAVRHAGAVRAHLDLQYLLARWGDELGAPDLPESSRIVPGYVYVDQHGQATLDAVWREDGTPSPHRAAEGCWILPVGAETLLNGHVPRHVMRYEASPARVTALLLRAAGPDASSWRTMREVFLGATDPARAHPASLRAAARRGDLALRGPVTFRNNAFHLSRGPLEAARERLVWFGGTTWQELSRRATAGSALGLALVDAPLGPVGAWAHAETAQRDAADPRVLEVLRQLSGRVTVS
jgi:adenylate kinase family enzyme